MKNLQKNKEVLELSKKFVIQGFKKLKKENPEYYETVRAIMYDKNVPSCLLKYFQRTLNTIDVSLSWEELIKESGLTKGQIKVLQKKWYSKSEILSMK